MMHKEYKYILIGLVSSGKTTFIAALWHAIDSPNSKCSFTLKKLSQDCEYLNAIRDKWIQCEPVARTVPGNESYVSINMIDTTNGNSFELCIPDMSGESFLAQWNDRYWNIEYDQLVDESSGVLIFIHPEEIRHSERIDQLNGLDIPAEEGDNKNIPKEWNQDLVPTQVILVDHLQFLENKIKNNEQKKLSIIISAWDLITEQILPDEWLKTRLPLLFQYLSANNDVFPYKIFGVSAQGGRYDNEQRDDLIKEKEPANRIVVVNDELQNKDIGLPIKWLME